MVGDMILDNTENPIESLNSDNENNFGEALEITTKDMEQVSENAVNETFDVIPTVDNDSLVIEEAQDLKRDLTIENNVYKKVDADSDEKHQFSVFFVSCFSIENPLILSDVIRHPTSVSPSIVSNDKENIDSERRKLPIVFVVEGKKGKKLERLRTLNEISIRQLRKQVKALTLKSINSNEEKVSSFFNVQKIIRKPQKDGPGSGSYNKTSAANNMLEQIGRR